MKHTILLLMIILISGCCGIQYKEDLKICTTLSHQINQICGERELEIQDMIEQIRNLKPNPECPECYRDEIGSVIDSFENPEPKEDVETWTF